MTVPRRLALAFGLGAIVFAIVVHAAWSATERQWHALPRQYATRDRLRRVGRVLDDYVNEHRNETRTLSNGPVDLPDFSPELPDFVERNAEGTVIDAWKRPFRYRKEGDKLIVLSLGRDGVAGGSGPDADLFSDRRNPETAYPSFRQFMEERDSAEIDARWVFIDAFGTAAVVAGLVFFGPRRLAVSGPHPVRDTIIRITMTVAVTIFVGMMLAQAHIPNGH